jgi:hypothetical protein
MRAAAAQVGPVAAPLTLWLCRNGMPPVAAPVSL